MGLGDRIEGRTARVAVMGLGYVGLPLVVALAKAGFPVTGVDVSPERVDAIQRGESYIGDVAQDELAPLVETGRLRATTNAAELGEADAIIICVPSPLQHNKAPDLSFIITAARQISGFLKKGQLVILQSTTYPGTTEEDVLPILEESGLKVGADFHLAFSPERINPGDKQHTVSNTPKVVGGVSALCGDLARRLFAAVHPVVHSVSSPRAAEMTKLLENTFRAVNIALVNEMAMLCERMGLDVWEVIAAASTKPFGYMPFFPGPGVGGHCIPVDPFFLLWKAREYDFHTKFIELAAEVNEAMPFHTVSKVVEALNSRQKSVKGARILVLGVTYKADVEDTRNSPATHVIELLLGMGADVGYSDPYVSRLHLGEGGRPSNGRRLDSVPADPDNLNWADCVVIITPHSLFDLPGIVARSSLLVDSCNATGSAGQAAGKVFKLGVGDVARDALEPSYDDP
ncbi:MAG: nucleotide sugar dehydrogenase [Dehalococcoidia bacterium]|nr:nucleotide sugar dehydrogenase [Dehalococcoidia bacterium]